MLLFFPLSVSKGAINLSQGGLLASTLGSKQDEWANVTMPIGNGTLAIKPNISNGKKRPKFVKVAVASGFEDILYEKALQTHIDHAEKWGYPLYMARESAADGMFNKVAYIMDIVLNELYKPAEERMEWLLYVGSYMCPTLPGETMLTRLSSTATSMSTPS